MGDASDPYEKYGLRRVINASTSMTRLGGSMPKPEVFRAMEEASRAFIRIPELQVWAERRIAEAFGVEAGLPTAGGSNGITLAAAACIMRDTELEGYDPLEPQTWIPVAQRLPMHTEGLKTEFVIQRSTRSEYDHAIECAGGTLVEAGSEKGATPEELEEAFDPERTAAYHYTITASKDRLPLADVARIAHERGVPVTVDAAPNLTHQEVPRVLMERGADLVSFSGGKHLGGLNNTGVLVGRKDLMKLAHLQSYPFDGIGRGAKMSREMIVGLVKAVELFVGRDDDAFYGALEEQSFELSRRLSEIPGVRSGVVYEPSVIEGVLGPSYAYIALDEGSGISLKELHGKLREGKPAVEALYEPFFVTPEAAGKITIKAEYLLKGDDEIILDRVTRILGDN